MGVVKLKIEVQQIDNVISLFDTIRVWRSETGEAGVYSLITADTAEAATVLGTVLSPFTVNGKTLTFKVDEGAEQTVTFASPDPVAAQFLLDEINTQATGATATEEGGALRLSSDTTGTASTLEITGGSALTDLGLSVGTVTGKDAHVDLQVGVDTYYYDDESWADGYFYKTQYYNSTNGSFSDLSDPREGGVGTIVSSTDLILATIDMADLEGKPLAEQTIVFNLVPSPLLEVTDIAILGPAIEVETDSLGHAEVSLVRGALVDVVFIGTGVVRRITVPTTGTSFDLMGAVASADDNFQIQVPDIPQAIRRS